ncbi:MAG: hypothetical protein RhofKO_39460 [Rhodothermales bacterium]
MKELHQFILQQEDEVYTLGPVSLDDIQSAEAELSHQLPEDVSLYVQKYGALSFGSVEFFGLGMKRSSHLHLVQQTLNFRKEKGFPTDAVVLEAIGDGHFAVCRPDGAVLRWAFPTYLDETSQLAPSAIEYMMMRLQEA